MKNSSYDHRTSLRVTTIGCLLVVSSVFACGVEDSGEEQAAAAVEELVRLGAFDSYANVTDSARYNLSFDEGARSGDLSVELFDGGRLDFDILQGTYSDAVSDYDVYGIKRPDGSLSAALVGDGVRPILLRGIVEGPGDWSVRVSGDRELRKAHATRLFLRIGYFGVSAGPEEVVVGGEVRSLPRDASGRGGAFVGLPPYGCLAVITNPETSDFEVLDTFPEVPLEYVDNIGESMSVTLDGTSYTIGLSVEGGNFIGYLDLPDSVVFSPGNTLSLPGSTEFAGVTELRLPAPPMGSDLLLRPETEEEFDANVRFEWNPGEDTEGSDWSFFATGTDSEGSDIFLSCTTPNDGDFVLDEEVRSNLQARGFVGSLDGVDITSTESFRANGDELVVATSSIYRPFSASVAE